jgi:hypothetical protein
MRFLRLLIAGLVILAGLVGAALLVVVGFVFFLLNRLFGRPTAMPRFRATFHTSRPVPPCTSQREDVIDVVTTDVVDTRTLR